MRLGTYTDIPQVIEYMQARKVRSVSMHRGNCIMDLPNHVHMLLHAQNAKKSALNDANQLSNNVSIFLFPHLSQPFPSTIRDGQSRLQLSTNVHQTPFVFPFFAWRVETFFPWLIERFEPVTKSR